MANGKQNETKSKVSFMFFYYLCKQKKICEK